MTSITVTKEIEISDYDIWRTLVGAFEGGSNYWYWVDEVNIPDGMTRSRKKPGWNDIVAAENKVRQADRSYLPYGERAEEDLDFLKEHNVYEYIHQIPFLGGSLKITERTGREMMDPPEIGIELGILDYDAIQRGLQLFADRGGRHWDDWRQENGDAITADVMLQLMLMGEIVYG